ncbi:hypothetical protein Y032_0043g856 [Ancylostoma ceylanicum]|uniref:Uncharacterized protein n=1 Tax=Ancylostoma ceylanicum TaxID=53326 RepID=A0A016UEC9_9BILA|nr:hypothetical protein Y032_0043g856 [Ancylostoma ceylanicum]
MLRYFSALQLNLALPPHLHFGSSSVGPSGQYFVIAPYFWANTKTGGLLFSLAGRHTCRRGFWADDRPSRISHRSKRAATSVESLLDIVSIPEQYNPGQSCAC